MWLHFFVEILFEKYFCIFKSECQLNGSNFSRMFIQMFHFSQLSMHFKLDETRTERKERPVKRTDLLPTWASRNILAASEIKALISSVYNSFQDDHYYESSLIVCKLLTTDLINKFFFASEMDSHFLSGASLLVFHNFGSKALPLKHRSSRLKIWNNKE